MAQKTQSQQYIAFKRNKYSFYSIRNLVFYDAAQIKKIIKMSEGWTCVINLQVKKRKYFFSYYDSSPDKTIVLHAGLFFMTFCHLLIFFQN